MMRSMFAGVSGLQAHQLMMDVVSDNIANINTPGFKASRTVFEDTLSQLMSGASGPSAALGGTNPEQIGLGVRVAANKMTDTQGALQTTGVPTDLAISGNGAFAVRAGAERMYTRAGSFSFDAAGNLTDPSGAIVQGWVANLATHTVDPGGPISDVKIPLAAPIPATPTANVGLGGNLSANTNVGDSPVTTTMTIFDNLGSSHDITISFSKTAPNTWSATVTDENGTSLGAPATLTFDPSTGKLATPTTPPSFTLSPTGVTPSTFALGFGNAATSGGITQYGGDNTAVATEQDGSAGASLRSYSIADDGTVTGVFSNGKSEVLAQIAIATFPNAAGLMKVGQGHYTVTAASGNPLLNVPGSGTAGTVVAGSLEMSNVDLSTEFTNLIIAQRGFQANSKVISTSDEMLQSLVNLKQ
jgi:flagellar hook protein FlgE